MAGLTDFIAGLLSSPPPSNQEVPTTPAPAPQQYPTHEDAQFAKKYDYSYGQPWAREFNDQQYRILTGDPNEQPMKTVVGDVGNIQKALAQHPTFGPNSKQLDDYYARAALASQNSGLAMLGFNPQKSAVDVMRDPNHVNILGYFQPGTEQLYANALAPSAIVHESIHRGVDKLKSTPYWNKDWNQYIKNDNGELLVRALMQQRMGNPETAIKGDIGDSQQAQARAFYSRPEYAKFLNDIDMAASQYMANKRPGGPR